MTNSERLDEAARELGSPPKELRLDEILQRARALFREMASTSRDSASATMDFQTINVRGRANAPGDFERSDRWNRSPAFVKARPGVYRRLSQDERTTFHRLWQAGERMLRRESFDASEWERITGKGSG